MHEPRSPRAWQEGWAAVHRGGSIRSRRSPRRRTPRPALEAVDPSPEAAHRRCRVAESPPTGDARRAAAERERASTTRRGRFFRRRDEQARLAKELQVRRSRRPGRAAEQEAALAVAEAASLAELVSELRSEHEAGRSGEHSARDGRPSKGVGATRRWRGNPRGEAVRPRSRQPAKDRRSRVEPGCAARGAGRRTRPPMTCAAVPISCPASAAGGYRPVEAEA
jgi:hypothetical protein